MGSPILVRSDRLERYFRRHPKAGLATTVFVLGVSIGVLVFEPGMWPLACAMSLFCGWAILKYVTVLRGRRGDRPRSRAQPPPR